METNIPRNKTARPRSQSLHSCICERFVYIPMICPLICLQQNRWTNREQIWIAQRVMNVEIGNEGRAVPFLGIHETDLVCSARIRSTILYTNRDVVTTKMVFFKELPPNCNFGSSSWSYYSISYLSTWTNIQYNSCGVSLTSYWSNWLSNWKRSSQAAVYSPPSPLADAKAGSNLGSPWANTKAS